MVRLILVMAAFATLIMPGIMPGLSYGHAGEKHPDGVSVDSPDSSTSLAQTEALPVDAGGPFALIDHNGIAVTDKSFPGKYMLVFFGYTNCQIMCSISLQRIGGALSHLDSEDKSYLDKLAPLVVTVDPANDTPERLRQSLGEFHPALLGLTGTQEQLASIYKAYGQNPKILEASLNDNAIVSHTSYFFLLDPDGKLKTFFPPVLNAESMAGILKKYIQM